MTGLLFPPALVAKTWATLAMYPVFVDVAVSVTLPILPYSDVGVKVIGINFPKAKRA
jgi:hypothetical protein